jgi:hypothetical protein
MQDIYYINKINKYQSEEFVEFKALPNKLVRIDSYEITEGDIEFTLRSSIGESFSFPCKRKKIEDFLDNFTILKIEQMSEETTKEEKGKTIKDVNDILFKALQGLSDGTMDIGTAQAISKVSQTIFNAAKLEIEYIKDFGKTGHEIKLLE